MSLKLTDLSHRYPPINHSDSPNAVFTIESWSLRPGERALLRGVSGSGKTTLLNIIAGLLTPSTGSVEIAAQNVYALGEARRDRFRARQIGFVFQTHHLLPGLSALENIEMPLALAGVHREERRQRAQNLLDRLGLASHAAYRPRQLSVGQRARIAVARALVAQPSLLLADEPTAALDPENGAMVMRWMTALCAEVNTILLVASHDPALKEWFTPAQTWQLRDATLTLAEEASK